MPVSLDGTDPIALGASALSLARPSVGLPDVEVDFASEHAETVSIASGASLPSIQLQLVMDPDQLAPVLGTPVGVQGGQGVRWVQPTTRGRLHPRTYGS